MKKVLAFDTATDELVVGLGSVEFAELPFIKLETKADTPCRRRANVELLPKAKELLDQQGLTFSDIDLFVVGRGPGSFTGVRIGIATAKGLAFAANKPLIGASTLDTVAYRAWLSGVRGRLGVVQDAMRGEVYPGIYTLEDTGVSREFEIETVEKTAACILKWKDAGLEDLQLTGDGLKKFGADFKAAGFSPYLEEELWAPSSEGLLYAAFSRRDVVEGLAEMSGVSGEISANEQEAAAPSEEHQSLKQSFSPQHSFGNSQLVLPVYTRLSDAEEHELEERGKKRPHNFALTGVDEESASEPYQYRPMKSSDVADVAQLEAATYADDAHTPWSPELFLQSLHPQNVDLKTSWWIAHKGGEVVGFAGAQLSGASFEILDIAVSPAHRREGIATKLLARVTYDGQMFGVERASLEVFSENEEALALYKERGFEEVGCRPDYYGQDQDALLLEAALPLAIPKSHTDPQPVRSALVWPQPALLAERTAEVCTQLEAAGDLVLAIETSCDETAMSIIDNHGTLIANVVSTQIDFHARFGGVVPEIASRKHTEALCAVLQETLEVAGRHFGMKRLDVSDLAAVAVTEGPGLVGALVVGIAFAKGLAAAGNLKLIGVNHLEGHLYANLLENPSLQPPFVASLVSGGHTMLVFVKSWGRYEILGQTIDDAVGEAFDKVAKALGLGYPGGPIISKLAEKGNAKAIDFPRALLHSHDYRFSLSGLKTAVVTYLEKEEREGRLINKNDVAASFQAAVIEVLVAKALDAVRECNVGHFCVGGGVAANPALRKAYEKKLAEYGVTLTVPPMSACTDNAAMIALVGLKEYKEKKFSDLSLDADPNLSL